MLIVLSTEFRDNLKQYLDEVSQENQVLIKRGRETFIVTKLTDADKISLNPDVIESVKRGLQQISEGEYREIKSGFEL